MNLYLKPTVKLIRLTISKSGEHAQYLALENTTLNDVEYFIKQIITNNVQSDPFKKDKKTSIVIREYQDGINGISKSVSFYGLSVDETVNLIKSKL